MGFDLQIASSVDQIGREAWDRLGAERPFSSYRWYRFGEKVLSADTPFYVILSRAGEPVARATFWLRYQESLPIPPGPIRPLVQLILRRWPLLVCRTPLSNTSGLILPDPPLRDEALQTVVGAAQEYLRQQHASFLLFDYLESDALCWACWPDTFVRSTLPAPGTRLSITWHDFGSYVRHLPKGVRKDFRRHGNRAVDLGIEVRRHPTVTDPERALALIRAVENHHRSMPNPWARAMLENASMVDFAWLTARIGDRLVGCGLLLGTETAYYLALLGLDCTTRYAYFQLLYAAIRSAIEDRVPVLFGGSEAYETKQRLGFRLETSNHVAFTTNGGALQLLATRLLVD